MYCTKGSDQEAVIQDHLQGKETQKAKCCLRRPFKQLRKEEKLKARRKGKIHPFECTAPKKQGEIRKPSSVISGKK